MRSLRLRLIAFAALAIAVALWAAWHVMGMLFEHYTERRMADALVRDGAAVAAAVHLDAQGRPVVDPTDLDARFRRRGSGLYWEVRAPGKTAGSPSLGGKVLGAGDEGREPVEASWQKDEVPGPYEDDLILVERRVSIGGTPVVVRVGEDDEPIDRAGASFAREMGMFLLALGVALALAAWVQVELGLWPLRRVRRELAAMARNPAQRLSDDHPQEIDALAQAINALATARSEDLVRARRRAADLAHALKTPLAALAAQSRVARAAGATVAADAIDQTLSAAAAVLESELARARAAASRAGEGVAATRPAGLIEGLVAVLERTDRGMSLVFDSDVPNDWEIGIDPDSFAEIFGNLLDNAARHARRVVRVSAAQADTRLSFVVDDDGPGIPADQRDGVLRRGVRLDESGSGHGLGLSIVADLIEATGGTITLGDAPEHGLRVTLSWPDALLTRAEPS
ncbi:MAG: sensor histidine kinase [Sphingomonas sp.]|uniref:sensor histidine kinase n=1 Tax=Sphingomonas sp. TaxID=28214 RepID=UPI003F7E37DF